MIFKLSPQNEHTSLESVRAKKLVTTKMKLYLCSVWLIHNLHCWTVSFTKTLSKIDVFNWERPNSISYCTALYYQPAGSGKLQLSFEILPLVFLCFHWAILKSWIWFLDLLDDSWSVYGVDHSFSPNSHSHKIKDIKPVPIAHMSTLFSDHTFSPPKNGLNTGLLRKRNRQLFSFLFIHFFSKPFSSHFWF